MKKSRKMIKYLMNDILLLFIIGRWKLSEYRQLTEIQLVLFWVFLVIVITWFPLKEEAEDTYKQKNHFFCSEIKGFYYRDIYVILQIVVMLIYGVYSSFFHKCDEKILIVWASIIIIPSVMIEEYYAHILRKRRVEEQSWGPYRYSDSGGRRAEKIWAEYENFYEFIKAFTMKIKNQNFILRKKYALSPDGSCWFFTRMGKITLEVIAVIGIKEMKYEHISEIDDICEDFFKNTLGITPIGYLTDCSYIICVDNESSTFRILLNNPICQSGIRFRGINAGLSFETKQLYISRQDRKWGLRRYKKMRDFLIKNIKHRVTGETV